MKNDVPVIKLSAAAIRAEAQACDARTEQDKAASDAIRARLATICAGLLKLANSPAARALGEHVVLYKLPDHTTTALEKGFADSLQDRAAPVFEVLRIDIKTWEIFVRRRVRKDYLSPYDLTCRDAKPEDLAALVAVL